jgi:hypothetical protein
MNLLGNDRRGPGTGGRPAFALAALLVLALGCLLATGYMYLQAQQRVDQLGTDLRNRVPLRETVVIRADAPTVVRRVQALSKLETSRYTLEKILDAKRTRQYVPEFLAGEKLVFVAHGEVVGGVDLSKLSREDVRVSGDSISVDLPEPEILYSRIDNEKSYVYERETGLFSEPDKDLESRIRATAEEQLRASALEDGILAESERNARLTLDALLTSMGYTEVTFR